MDKKALTVKQPYAYLICKGIKDIENRTWKTKYRGRVYIHASGSSGKKFNINLTDEQMIAAFGSIADEAINKDYHFGAIIGHVDIVDCVINYSSVWADKSEGVLVGHTFVYKKDQKPIYNWVLANPVLYEKPILDVKGKLSFWNCSTYIEGQ